MSRKITNRINLNIVIRLYQVLKNGRKKSFKYNCIKLERHKNRKSIMDKAEYNKILRLYLIQ